MNYGKSNIVLCPICGKKFERLSLLSGNTFGALVWTDGRMIAPMLPELPYISKCDSCSSFMWVNEMKEDEPHNIYEEDLEYDFLTEINVLEELNAEQYLEAIKAGIARNKEEELYLRVRYWQISNDKFRNDIYEATTAEKIFDFSFPLEDNQNLVANLEELLNILPSDDYNFIIMKAEILRELGRFEECITFLNSIKEETYDENVLKVIDKIYILAKNNDKNIKVLNY